MVHKLTVELPDSVFEPLADAARRSGTTPEALAIEWLNVAIRSAANDPFEPLIGSVRTNSPGWGDKHDELFGRSVMGGTNGPDAAPGHG